MKKAFLLTCLFVMPSIVLAADLPKKGETCRYQDSKWWAVDYVDITHTNDGRFYRNWRWGAEGYVSRDFAKGLAKNRQKYNCR